MMKTAMEELIESLKETRDLPQNKFSYPEFNHCIIQAEKLLAKEQQQLENAVDKWIDVKERLPDESDYYLIWSTAKCGIEWFNKAEGYFGINISYKYLPTYWQPLPNPPAKS